MALVTDIDQLSQAISHATAPAFMLGAVAAFLSLLIARLERVGDKIRALRTSDANLDQTGRLAAAFTRRMELLNRAIFFAVLSALLTAALLICAFLAALLEVGHVRVVATLFAAALALLMASLVDSLERCASIWRTCAWNSGPSPRLGLPRGSGAPCRGMGAEAEAMRCPTI